MKTGIIKQTVNFSSKPEIVYDLIMDEKKHSAFTGGPVTMSIEINGKFNIFDGYCQGYNIELDKGKKIIQGWHFAEDGWPEEHFSKCTFIFEPEGEGTKLTFTQSDIPEHKVADLTEGWNQYYWDPMKKYLMEHK